MVRTSQRSTHADDSASGQRAEPVPRGRPYARNRRGVSRAAVIVLVAIVVVMVIIGGFFAAGFFSPKGGGGSAVTYSVTFAQHGLASGTSWSVTLNGATQSSSTGSLVFAEANGVYSYTVGSVPGYAASPRSASLTVNGAAVTESVTFTPIPPTEYAVTFSEGGLPSGTSWSVTLGGVARSSTTTSIAFTEPNGTYSYSLGSVSGYTVNPSSGSLTVNGAAVSESITFTAVPPKTYAVTFTESGLPSGTTWSMTFDNSPGSSASPTIAFTEVNGTYSYTVGPVSGFTASPSSGSVMVRGEAVSQAITFTPTLVTTYPVTFSESGLPPGTSWSITLNGAPSSSTTSTIAFTEQNGSYSYTVGTVSGYAASPSSGSVTVTGSSVSKAITFTAIPPAKYSVAFTESGLPSGTTWSVTVHGATLSSTTSTVTFSEANGTYSYTVGPVSGYTANPSSGSVTVNGAQVSEVVTFTAVPPNTFPVTFTESGLPSGTGWSVTLNEVTHGASGVSVMFDEANGTYPYTVGSVSGYTASPSSGSVTVSGAGLTESITFTPIPPTTYTLTFTESGLPPGTGWSVTLNRTTLGSTTASIVFTEPNGTYVFVVGAVTGYSVSPANGTVTVSGGSASVAVTFSSKPVTNEYPVTFSQTGLPANDTWQVYVSTSGFAGRPASIGGAGVRAEGPIPGNGSGLGPGAAISIGAQGSSLTMSLPTGTYYYLVMSLSNQSYYVNPTVGNLTVENAPTSVSVEFSTEVYPVEFTESGLPQGATWFVTLDGVTRNGTVGSSRPIALSAPNGSQSYAPGTTESGYAPAAPYGTFTVNGAEVTINVTFVTAYNITFRETGLPTSVYWYVLINETGPSEPGGQNLSFELPNGTYGFTVGAYGSYTASPSSGSLRVNGAPVLRQVAFVPIPLYTVTFRESGLGLGVNFSVTLNAYTQEAVPGQNITFNETNGTYSFLAAALNYRASPATGTVTVNGTAKLVTITFTALPLFRVTFTETGLPNAETNWEVTLGPNGASTLEGTYFELSTTPTIVMDVPNGNYSWWVMGSDTPGYVPSPVAGGLSIQGQGANESITFQYAPQEHLLFFQEYAYSYFGSYGVPNGTSWSVTVGRETQTTTGMFLGFLEPNGTYSFTITGPTGYVAVMDAGSLTLRSPSLGINAYNPDASVYVLFVPGTPGSSTPVGPTPSLPAGSTFPAAGRWV